MYCSDYSALSPGELDPSSRARARTVRPVEPAEPDADALSHQPRFTACGPVEFEVPGIPEMIRLVRERVAEFAQSLPFSADQIEDLRIAVGEAATNAIRHGHHSPPCAIHVRMECVSDCLKVYITDQGCGFDPDSVGAPSMGSLDSTGRGIMLMRALVDEVKFHAASPGTRVELTKRFGLGKAA